MPELSVVVPVHNERDNIVPLLTEIVAALRGKTDFEIVYVDDASKDDTLAVLAAAKTQFPELRVVRHLSQSGQSTAVRTGVKAARGAWIATLDGDGQNDPADIPKLHRDARRVDRDDQAVSPAGAYNARTAAASAGPRVLPTRYAAACCATIRRTPVAASSCSSAPHFSTCPISTTCTAICRR